MKFYRCKIENRWWGEDSANVPYFHIEEIHPAWEEIEPDFDLLTLNLIGIRATAEEINRTTYIKRTDDDGMNVAYYHFMAHSAPMNMDNGTITWDCSFILDQWMTHMLYRLRGLIKNKSLVKILRNHRNRCIQHPVTKKWYVDFNEQTYLKTIDGNKQYELKRHYDPALTQAFTASQLNPTIKIAYTEARKTGQTLTNALMGLYNIDTTGNHNDAFYFNNYMQRYRYILAQPRAVAKNPEIPIGAISPERQIQYIDNDGNIATKNITDEYFILAPANSNDFINDWNAKYGTNEGLLAEATIISFFDSEIPPSILASLCNKRFLTNAAGSFADDIRIINSAKLPDNNTYPTLINGDFMVIDNKMLEVLMKTPTGDNQIQLIKEINRIQDAFDSSTPMETIIENEPFMYNNAYFYQEWSIAANNNAKIVADMLDFHDEANNAVSLCLVFTDEVAYAWGLKAPNKNYNFTENNDLLYFTDNKKVVYTTSAYAAWLLNNSTTEQTARANITDSYDTGKTNANLAKETAQTQSTISMISGFMGASGASSIKGGLLGLGNTILGQASNKAGIESHYEQQINSLESSRRQATASLNSQISNIKSTPNSMNIPAYKAALFARLATFQNSYNFNYYCPAANNLNEIWYDVHWFGYRCGFVDTCDTILNRVHRNFIQLDTSFNIDKLKLDMSNGLPEYSKMWDQPEYCTEFLGRLAEGFHLHNINPSGLPYTLEDKQNWEVNGNKPLESILLEWDQSKPITHIEAQNWTLLLAVKRTLTPSDGTYIGYQYHADTYPTGVTYDSTGVHGVWLEDGGSIYIHDTTDQPEITSNELMTTPAQLIVNGDYSDWYPKLLGIETRTYKIQQLPIIDTMSVAFDVPVDWITATPNADNDGFDVVVDTTVTRPFGDYWLTFSIQRPNSNIITRRLRINIRSLMPIAINKIEVYSNLNRNLLYSTPIIPSPTGLPPRYVIPTSETEGVSVLFGGNSLGGPSGSGQWIAYYHLFLDQQDMNNPRPIYIEGMKQEGSIYGTYIRVQGFLQGNAPVGHVNICGLTEQFSLVLNPQITTNKFPTLNLRWYNLNPTNSNNIEDIHYNTTGGPDDSKKFQIRTSIISSIPHAPFNPYI